MAEFTAKYPDIPIDMKNGNHEDLYEQLRSNQVDLVLNDQRRVFSDEYVNIVLTVISCHIEISVRNPIAGLEYVNVSGKGFLLIEGGEAPTQFAEILKAQFKEIILQILIQN